MPTRSIHIEGMVQGVGFRPHIYRLALQHHLKGWVSNEVDGVHITVSGTESSLAAFASDVLSKPPLNARISRAQMDEIPELDLVTFQIIDGKTGGEPNVMLTPDLGLCEECRKEITEAGNRRESYPFTTCVRCGPRYSIMTGLPYDRPLTTMAPFVMCRECDREYHDASHRRFFSQTNSCPHCAVELTLMSSSGKILSSATEAILENAVQLLRGGAILAVKSTGGYLLMVDASNAESVALLRQRKQRPSKPFALLFKDMVMARHFASVSDAEEKELTSLVCPIVLLNRKEHNSLRGVAPGLDRLGIMLPSTPLLALLADRFNGPLVATSGNISGSPIFYTDSRALQNLGDVADYFLMNNREIVVPQDDSVIQFARFGGPRIVLRRSRGMAPLVFRHPLITEAPLLSMGADMKSAFALALRGNLYISQYLGDLDNFDTQQAYDHTLHHLLQVFKAKPAEVIVDRHPMYYSTQMGHRMAEEWCVPVHEVQHHHAHFGAVLAENNCLDDPAPVLGVIWDGTGLGDDGAVWGGEFFRYEKQTINRVHHLDYFSHFLGDKFSREPRLSAMALAVDQPGGIALLEKKFSDTEWRLYKALAHDAPLRTSSIGRLFDGIASLLGLCDHASYEGEAALYLENCARHVLDRSLPPLADFTTKSVVREVIYRLNQGHARSDIAYQFHVSLVRWIERVARIQGCRTIALSGGVFQNALLNELLATLLGDEFELLFHRELSPNDECIAYGQLACRQIERKSAALIHQTQSICA